MSISEDVPLNILQVGDSHSSKVAREVKASKKISKISTINAQNSRGYDVVDDFEDDSICEYRFPDSPKICDYAMHPIRSCRAFGRRLIRNFGWKFCILLGFMYFGVKGLLLSATSLARLSYCKKSLHIDGTACQTMGAIASTPWALKGAMGVLSDVYPCFGFHKASYVILASVLGTLAFAGLAALPASTAMASAALLFLANLEIAIADILCQGKYAELMQERPHTGSTMVSYVWGLFQLGSLTASLFVGPIADAFDPQIIFWGCVPVAASIMIPVSLGFLQDEPVPKERRGVDWALMHQHPYIMGFCLVVAAVALGNAAIDTGFFSSPGIQLCYALAAALLLCILNFLWLPRQLARCSFYFFVSRILYVSVGGAQDFWFTADSNCVPAGPSFDYTYYNTYAAIVGASASWLSIVIFQATLSSWPFRRLFIFTSILQVSASIYDILIINRWNLSVGIRDKEFYIFGDGVLKPVVTMFGAMPTLVLTSKLVPKGLEATVYALLAGFHNFGSVVSSQIGLFAMEVAGIKTTAPCNFENLSTLVLVCHCLLPSLTIPLIFWLIPNKLMTDRLIDEKFAVITSDAGVTSPADIHNGDDVDPGSPLALMARSTGTRLAGHVE